MDQAKGSYASKSAGTWGQTCLGSHLVTQVAWSPLGGAGWWHCTHRHPELQGPPAPPPLPGGPPLPPWKGLASTERGESPHPQGPPLLAGEWSPSFPGSTPSSH